MIKHFQELSKLNKILVLFGVITILVLVVSAFNFKDHFIEVSQDNSEVSDNNAPPDSIVHVEEQSTELDLKKFDKIGTLISDYHDFYNKTLGWGKFKTVKKEKQLGRVEALISSLSVFNNNDVDKKDLKNMEQLATIYVETEETEALLYLHRIFHDLDKAVNNYKHKDTFGATYTHGKKGFFGNQLDDIEDYIEEKVD